MLKNKLINFKTKLSNLSINYFYKNLINKSQGLALNVKDTYTDANGFHIKKGNDEVIISKSVIKDLCRKKIKKTLKNKKHFN